MASLSKLQSECQKNILGNLFPEKKNKKLWFSDFERKKFGFPAEQFRQACQKFNLGDQGNILRKNNNFEIKYMFFLVVFGLPDFSEFWQKRWVRLSKLHFTSPGEEFEQKYFFWRKLNYLFIFVTLAKKLGFWRKISASSSSPHSRCPEERTEEKKFWKETFSISFVHWPKKNSVFGK